MITEDYVNFEIAKLLKEKGFDEECIGYYVDYEPNDVKYSFMGETNSSWEPRCYSAPTLQKAIKWLRETHNIAIETEWEHLWYAYVKPMTSKPSEEDCYQCESPKYEQACEEAVRYCLENLI